MAKFQFYRLLAMFQPLRPQFFSLIFSYGYCRPIKKKLEIPPPPKKTKSAKKCILKKLFLASINNRHGEIIASSSSEYFVSEAACIS